MDYQPTNGTLTFVAGETSKAARGTVCEDVVTEVSKTDRQNLSNPSNATLADDQGRGSALNDDGAGAVAFIVATATSA